MQWLGSITDSMDVNLNKLLELVEDRGAWHAIVHGIPRSQTRLNNWVTTVGKILNLNGNIKLSNLNLLQLRYESLTVVNTGLQNQQLSAFSL